ncbi:pectinesterase inhibitor 10-like [Camellia sinensis]|uniref:pectinesterase n=1 Tax=Camellia sinensis var. sinensis TaxID=542762 RepID=A0A4V3WP16_CAMSN|nr:pectinesterase inhibitor 10-like [Camellia sinensis]THG14677.1 hypothetical protein TEA_004747 [Camellia sinensis var. sinensis]
MESSFLSHVLTTLFILLQFTAYMPSCLANKPIPTNANTDFIKKSCTITLYPQLCYDSLSIFADKIKTSRKNLATFAISVTLSAAQSASDFVTKLSKSPGLSPVEASALADCVELSGNSADELSRSLKEIANTNFGDPNFGREVNDIQTFVSAALTDFGTCFDGISKKASGQVKTKVGTQVLNVEHLTSNALAFISSYGTGPQTTSP